MLGQPHDPETGAVALFRIGPRLDDGLDQFSGGWTSFGRPLDEAGGTPLGEFLVF